MTHAAGSISESSDGTTHYREYEEAVTELVEKAHLLYASHDRPSSCITIHFLFAAKYHGFITWQT